MLIVFKKRHLRIFFILLITYTIFHNMHFCLQCCILMVMLKECFETSSKKVYQRLFHESHIFFCYSTSFI